jgi:hypothetical protein
MNRKAAAQKAVFQGIHWAREKVPRAWYRFTSPGQIDEVSRKDVRPMFLWIRAKEFSRERTWRPNYAFGLLTAAWIAAGHGIDEISAIELGVAGGTGLIAMERYSKHVKDLLGVKINCYGFDTGSGMPPAVDQRDAPFSLYPGTCGMDEQLLRSKLTDAELILGDVAETIPAFLERDYAPIGFVSNEIDYYSATMETFKLLDAPPAKLIPRVIFHFHSVMWHPWTQALGNLAAIDTFNATHERRKISPMVGLRFEWLPNSEFRKRWPDRMFVTEVFDHPQYDEPQGVPALDQRLVE